jgi:hypothetical protein
LQHTDIQKYTWKARRRRTRTTDNVLTNTKLLHMILHMRVYRASDIESDHSLVISKLAIPVRWHKFRANGQHKAKETNYTFKRKTLQNIYIREGWMFIYINQKSKCR